MGCAVYTGFPHPETDDLSSAAESPSSTVGAYTDLLDELSQRTASSADGRLGQSGWNRTTLLHYRIPLSQQPSAASSTRESAADSCNPGYRGSPVKCAPWGQ